MAFVFVSLLMALLLLYFGSDFIRVKGQEPLALSLSVIGTLVYFSSFYFSLRCCDDIGFGLEWTRFTRVTLGLICPLVGLLMLIVLQYCATKGIAEYGLRTGVFGGVNKAAIKAKIEEMAAMEQASQPIQSAL